MPDDPMSRLRHLVHDEPQPASWRALQQLLEELEPGLLPVAPPPRENPAGREECR